MQEISDCEAAASTHVRRRIWDVPTRIVHWALAALVAFSWWTAEIGELGLHRLSGYGILTLVLFRIYWGVVGSSTARFRSFVASPRAVLGYVRLHLFDRTHISPGHNPLGSWSIVAMLALLATQTSTGLFAVDVDAIESGPLTHLVSFETGRALAEFHESTFDVLLVLIALHLLAVIYYTVYKRDTLVRAMLGGSKRLPRSSGEGDAVFAPWWKVGIGAVLAAAVVAWVAWG
jgi:cytochrome b